MDTFEPFKEFQFKNIIIPIKRYEEYSNGKLLSKESANLTVVIEQLQDKIAVHLVENTLTSKIVSEFEFDLLFTLNDRLQLTIFPKETNVENILFTQLKWIISHTRESKNFSSNEPIVGHIFTDNMNIIKITFKMSNPERLIEFYT